MTSTVLESTTRPPFACLYFTLSHYWTPAYALSHNYSHGIWEAISSILRASWASSLTQPHLSSGSSTPGQRLEVESGRPRRRSFSDQPDPTSQRGLINHGFYLESRYEKNERWYLRDQEIIFATESRPAHDREGNSRQSGLTFLREIPQHTGTNRRHAAWTKAASVLGIKLVLQLQLKPVSYAPPNDWQR